MRLYKYMGTWMDVDHLLAANGPTFVDKMGSGGYFIKTTLHFMFTNEPLVLQRRIQEPKYLRWVDGLVDKWELLLTDGSWVPFNHQYVASSQAVHDAILEYNGLIQFWNNKEPQA